jgi:DNA-binding NarL/FixJ family response regulator
MAVLTPRQKMIERLVRRGMTSRRIAEQLGISQRTVEVHRANIARRLSAAPDRDPLDHPAVQKILKRLSHRVAVLVMELEQIRGAR